MAFLEAEMLDSGVLEQAGAAVAMGGVEQPAGQIAAGAASPIDTAASHTMLDDIRTELTRSQPSPAVLSEEAATAPLNPEVRSRAGRRHRRHLRCCPSSNEPVRGEGR